MIGHDHMTDQAIYEKFERPRVEADVGEFSPYGLCRSFISNLFDVGADLSVVQRLAGYDDTNTTSGWEQRDKVAK